MHARTRGARARARGRRAAGAAPSVYKEHVNNGDHLLQGRDATKSEYRISIVRVDGIRKEFSKLRSPDAHGA